MRNNQLFLLFLVMSGLPQVARAQALPVFVDAAAQRNVEARLSVEARTRAEAELGEAWGALLPVLTASGGWTHNQYPATIDLGTKTITITPADQLDATFKVEVPVIDAARWLKTSASAQGADASVARAQATQDQVRRQVVSAYFSYTAARAVLESANRSLAVARSQLDFMTARTQAGVANELELVRAQAEVERNNQVVADAESLLATSARSLRTLSGLEPGDVPGLPQDDLHAEPALPELEKGLDALPQVQAAQKDAETAARTMTAASLALVPTLNAQFTQKFTNATGFANQTSLYNAGLTFNWRLDVPAVHTLRAQHSAQATAELNAEKTRTAASDQLHSDWQKVKAAITKVRAAGAQVTSARRASSLSSERYGAGVATQLDVIQASRDLLVAELNDIQARAELASARAALKLSAGVRDETR